MQLMETFKFDFNAQQIYLWQMFKDNLELTLHRLQGQPDMATHSQNNISEATSPKESTLTPSKSKTEFQKSVEAHSAQLIISRHASKEGPSAVTPLPPMPPRKAEEGGESRAD
jgi:hypothetical protein